MEKSKNIGIGLEVYKEVSMRLEHEIDSGFVGLIGSHPHRWNEESASSFSNSNS